MLLRRLSNFRRIGQIQTQISRLYDLMRSYSRASYQIWKCRKTYHNDVIKWKLCSRNWPFVRGIHRSRWIPRTKGQWRGTLIFSLICVWINSWVNNREAGDLRRHRGHYDVSVMSRVTLHSVVLHIYTIHVWVHLILEYIGILIVSWSHLGCQKTHVLKFKSTLNLLKRICYLNWYDYVLNQYGIFRKN